MSDSSLPSGQAPASPVTPAQEPSHATLALVLALLSYVTCGFFLSIPAIIIASREISAIRAGRRAADRLSMARGAFWAGLGNLLLTAVVVPLVFFLMIAAQIPSRHNVRAARARGDCAEIAKSIARERTDTGNVTHACLYDLNHLAALRTPPECGRVGLCTEVKPGDTCWGGPYMTAISNDPWGHPYQVQINDRSYAITVTSAGPDGAMGTADDISYVQ